VRQELYRSFRHSAGHSRHAPCSIACVMATGTLDWGTNAKIRRVTIPSSRRSPAAIGFSP
jgi:hypothetical protein